MIIYKLYKKVKIFL